MALDPSTAALTVLLFGAAGLSLLITASFWRKVGKDRERIDEAPKLPVHLVRDAANVTVVSFGCLGLALLWFALLVMSAG